jgi:hypothetical protein
MAFFKSHLGGSILGALGEDDVPYKGWVLKYNGSLKKWFIYDSSGSQLNSSGFNSTTGAQSYIDNFYDPDLVSAEQVMAARAAALTPAAPSVTTAPTATTPMAAPTATQVPTAPVQSSWATWGQNLITNLTPSVVTNLLPNSMQPLIPQGGAPAPAYTPPPSKAKIILPVVLGLGALGVVGFVLMRKRR